MGAMVQESRAKLVLAQHDDGPMIVITGAIGVHTAADLRADLHEIIDGGRGDLLLDLGGAEIEDTTALGMLLECRRRAERKGRGIRLVAVSPSSARLLRRLALSRQFGPARPAYR